VRDHAGDQRSVDRLFRQRAEARRRDQACECRQWRGRGSGATLSFHGADVFEHGGDLGAQTGEQQFKFVAGPSPAFAQMFAHVCVDTIENLINDVAGGFAIRRSAARRLS